jgi:glutamate synthase domain-containing protein 2
MGEGGEMKAGRVADNSAKKGHEILDCALARFGVPTGIRTPIDAKNIK